MRPQPAGVLLNSSRWWTWNLRLSARSGKSNTSSHIQAFCSSLTVKCVVRKYLLFVSLLLCIISVWNTWTWIKYCRLVTLVNSTCNNLSCSTSSFPIFHTFSANTLRHACDESKKTKSPDEGSTIIRFFETFSAVLFVQTGYNSGGDHLSKCSVKCSWDNVSHYWKVEREVDSVPLRSVRMQIGREGEEIVPVSSACVCVCVSVCVLTDVNRF